MISLEDVKNYILIIREEELGNDYKLSDEQLKICQKVDAKKVEDPSFKNKLDRMLIAKNSEELKNIWYDKIPIVKLVDYDTDNFIEDMEDDEIIETPVEKEKQYVKKAGFVDVLTLSIVTGFISGVGLMILFALLK